jgi:hypothetical protein
MGPGNQDRVSPLQWRALAGIEAGILGGLAMFGWLAISSLLDLRSIWVVPNLLGSTLSGRPVLQHGFGWPTVAGLGLHLFVSGTIGMSFGLAVGDSRNRLRVTLLGIVTGLVWYYFSQLLFWRKLGVFVMVYSPPRQMLLGHLVYGLVLGWFPSGLRSLRRSLLGNMVGPVETHETAAAPDSVE